MLDGHSKIDDLVKAVAADGQPALGITDHGNMYGTLAFYKACKKHGVKPIIGSELYQAQNHVSDRPKTKKKVVDDTGDTGQEGGGKLYYHLTALAENKQGYHNLIKLSSESFIREEAYYYKPRVDWEMLDEYHKGLIVTSGCLGGQVLQSLLRDDYTVARHVAGKFQDIFGKENFLIEIQDHGLPEQDRTNPQLIRLSRDIGAPLLLTNDSHYVHREDHFSHDILLCCQTKAKIHDKDRFKFEGTEHYVKTAAEMRSLFPDLNEASDNTLWVAERCDVEIEMGVASLPHVPTPEGYEDNFEYLMEKCVEGCFERYGAPIPGEVLERLRFEIETVNEMGFIDYFLIVGDLIDYSKSRGIRVGPGRGSAAGSIIAYSLGITDIDPLRYGLLFERFLNPARVSMPDIDMDWDTRYRDDMIQYCIDKYGYDHVANIITYASIKSRSAVRDTVRVLDLPYEAGNKLVDLMPPLISGFETPLENCFEYDERYERGYADAADLRKLYEREDLKLSGQQVISNKDVRRVIDVARGLEGLRRQDGVHAAAVVLSDKPLVEYLPVQRKPAKKGSTGPHTLVTQFDMGDVEDLGLLKMDFLGLKNLDIISDTLDLISERHGLDLDISFGKIDLQDRDTIALLNKAETSGIFQVESVVMRDTIRAMNLDSFEDLAALNALCRPGPMADGMHFAYGARKNGREEATTFHPDAVEILGDTYNLMVYQEQLMAITQKFAGYSLGEGYLLLKACAKKKKDLMASEKDRFIQGCINNGYGENLGHEIWNIIEPFASYSFNKSHAVAYAFISYQTAYLKANYPVEYMSCLLSANMSKPDKLRAYLNECRRMGIKVRSPQINYSSFGFSPVNNHEISFGFEGVKGVGHTHAVKIIEERKENGAFLSFFDFCERMLDKSINSKMLSALIMTGAFEEPRLGLMEIMDEFLQHLRKRRKKTVKNQGQFDFDNNILYPEIKKIPISIEKLLEVESEYLGLYISTHPLHHISAVPIGTVDIADVVEYDNSADVVLVGVVDKVEVKTTRRGERMAILTFQDLTGSADLVVFPKLYNKISDLLVKGTVLLIEASYEISNTRSQFICRDIEPYE
jgi:DNA polymerase-3 subunit alpha